MKKIIFTAMVLLFGCSIFKGPKIEEVIKKEDYVIKVLDGCEYIEVSYAPGSSVGLYSLCHKGNCKNTIHLKN